MYTGLQIKLKHLKPIDHMTRTWTAYDDFVLYYHACSFIDDVSVKAGRNLVEFRELTERTW